MRRLLCGVNLVLGTVLALGCGEVPAPQRSAAPVPVPLPTGQKPAPVSTAVNPAGTNPAAANVQQPAKKPPERARPKQREVARAEAAAMKAVTTAIRSSVEIGPTLVIWIIDGTTSAHDIVHEVSAAAENFYESPEVAEWSAAAERPLLTAIVAFDQEVQFVIDSPTHDAKKVCEAFESIRAAPGGQEKTFTAIKQALERYLPLRTRDRREVLLVVVTDEAGDDANLVDEIIEPTRKQAIPVYAIGLPSPWGQTNPFAANSKSAEQKDDSTPTVGPESLLSERVDIENWNAKKFDAVQTDLVDSGFGPFALERLCRASRGQFFALRPGLGYGYRSVNARVWPNGNELRFDESVVGRYTPDYVSETEYKKLLAENKACAALVEAARLPKVAMEGTPGSIFPKDVEAKMAKQMSAAQQFAARNLPPVERLHDILIKGEGDRSKLTSPRWQAEYDLAFGRVLASQARLDGYNSMIAALKRGKNFQNPESKAWELKPADNFETESTIKKSADKAKTYLERVMKEHPKTPWATIAEEELKLPLGWAWEETNEGGPPAKAKGKKGK